MVLLGRQRSPCSPRRRRRLLPLPLPRRRRRSSPFPRHKRRILMIEAWLGIIIFVALSLWMILSARNVMGKETLLSTREKELTQSARELKMLADLTSLKAQRSDQGKLMAHVGPNLPMARLIGAIEQMMPKEMALLDVEVESQ